MNPQILADQLILSQPGQAYYAHNSNVTHGFSDIPTALPKKRGLSTAATIFVSPCCCLHYMVGPPFNALYILAKMRGHLQPLRSSNYVLTVPLLVHCRNEQLLAFSLFIYYPQLIIGRLRDSSLQVVDNVELSIFCNLLIKMQSLLERNFFT